MATVLQVIERAYAKVNGETEKIVENSDDYNSYLMALNHSMEVWATTPYVKWQLLFNPDYVLATVVTEDVLEYEITDADRIVLANTPRDAIYLIKEGLVVKKMKMVDQALFQSSTSRNICMMVDDKLYFKELSDDIIGAAINLPVYMLPPLHQGATETVRIDSTVWLVTEIAAYICDASPVPFIARNAKKYEKQATDLMKTMKSNNRRSQMLSIKKVGDRRFNSLSSAIDAGVGIGGGSFDNLE